MPSGSRKTTVAMAGRERRLGEVRFGSRWQATGVRVKGVKFWLLLSFTDIVNEKSRLVSFAVAHFLLTTNGIYSTALGTLQGEFQTLFRQLKKKRKTTSDIQIVDL